jgi:homoserine dehydrogenase
MTTASSLKPLRIAIAGLGTVGGTVVSLVQEQAAMLARLSGREITIVAVSARDKHKNRGVDLQTIRWEENPLALAAAADVDVVIETIGGSGGTAFALVEAALKAGKDVITANKALLAEHGVYLASLAEQNQAMLAFEAAVAGGIPIVKTLREGLAANRYERIIGILNGTSNFILTQMENEGSTFEEALAEATRLGYAEADPSYDIDGIDTAQKLCLLTALAFGCRPDFAAIPIEGVRGISHLDMFFADELGYSIKLLGVASRHPDGRLEQRVYPCMLPADSPIGVDDVFNAIVVEGHAVGRVMLEGRGAGGGPTASAIVADVLDIARGHRYLPFTLPLDSLPVAQFTPIGELMSAWYLRLAVQDKAGVLADVTRIFAEEDISLQSFLQHSHQPQEAVQLVLTTHLTSEMAMQRARAKIEALAAVTEKTHCIRIAAMA